MAEHGYSISDGLTLGKRGPVPLEWLPPRHPGASMVTIEYCTV
jgi:hypothetical protein